MKLLPLCLAAAFLAVSCQNADAPEDMSAQTEIGTAIETSTEKDDVDFRDVLRQYQDLNTRLETVAYRLQKANAALCPVTLRSAGFTVHMITDYPENLQPIARELLSVSNRLSVRTVRAGSSAQKAGLSPGDEIVQIFGAYIPSGPTSKTLYEAAAKRAFENYEAVIKVRRSDQVLDMILTPETLCGYPVNVFFSERINGHTDGQDVWITSELMRSETEDVNLALVVAHEMAHAIAGHTGQPPSESLELMADSMALIMLARAGYDIEKTAGFWQDTPYPHYGTDEEPEGSTHPSAEARHDNFVKTRLSITEAQRKNTELNFGKIQRRP